MIISLGFLNAWRQLPPCACWARVTGVKCSWTNVALKKNTMIRKIPVNKKVHRIEKTWAMIPPNTGPIRFPLTYPVVKIPSALPLLFRGVSAATRALALGMYPANRPWRNRNPINCQTLVTKPISPITRAIPNDDRNSISFRPFRSAKRPHTGEINAITKNVTAYVTPLYKVSCPLVKVPKSSTYKERNGMISLKPMPAINVPNHSTARLRRHCSGFRFPTMPSPLS